MWLYLTAENRKEIGYQISNANAAAQDEALSPTFRLAFAAEKKENMLEKSKFSFALPPSFLGLINHLLVLGFFAAELFS